MQFGFGVYSVFCCVVACLMVSSVSVCPAVAFESNHDTFDALKEADAAKIGVEKLSVDSAGFDPGQLETLYTGMYNETVADTTGSGTNMPKDAPPVSVRRVSSVIFDENNNVVSGSESNVDTGVSRGLVKSFKTSHILFDTVGTSGSVGSNRDFNTTIQSKPYDFRHDSEFIKLVANMTRHGYSLSDKSNHTVFTSDIDITKLPPILDSEALEELKKSFHVKVDDYRSKVTAVFASDVFRFRNTTNPNDAVDLTFTYRIDVDGSIINPPDIKGTVEQVRKNRQHSTRVDDPTGSRSDWPVIIDMIEVGGAGLGIGLATIMRSFFKSWGETAGDTIPIAYLMPIPSVTSSGDVVYHMSKRALYRGYQLSSEDNYYYNVADSQSYESEVAAAEAHYELLGKIAVAAIIILIILVIIKLSLWLNYWLYSAVTFTTEQFREVFGREYTTNKLGDYYYLKCPITDKIILKYIVDELPCLEDNPGSEITAALYSRRDARGPVNALYEKVVYSGFINEIGSKKDPLYDINTLLKDPTRYSGQFLIARSVDGDVGVYVDMDVMNGLLNDLSIRVLKWIGVYSDNLGIGKWSTPHVQKVWYDVVWGFGPQFTSGFDKFQNKYCDSQDGGASLKTNFDLDTFVGYIASVIPYLKDNRGAEVYLNLVGYAYFNNNERVVYSGFTNKTGGQNNPFDNVDNTFDNVDNTFDNVDNTFDNVDNTFDNGDRLYDINTLLKDPTRYSGQFLIARSAGGDVGVYVDMDAMNRVLPKFAVLPLKWISVYTPNSEWVDCIYGSLVPQVSARFNAFVDQRPIQKVLNMNRNPNLPSAPGYVLKAPMTKDILFDYIIMELSYLGITPESGVYVTFWGGGFGEEVNITFSNRTAAVSTAKTGVSPVLVDITKIRQNPRGFSGQQLVGHNAQTNTDVWLDVDAINLVLSKLETESYSFCHIAVYNTETRWCDVLHGARKDPYRTILYS